VGFSAILGFAAPYLASEAGAISFFQGDVCD
jgi:hypothetical protein